MSKNNATIAAIDPGKDKCGVAVLYESGVVVEQKIIPTATLADELQHFLKDYQIRRIVIGNGTTSKTAQEKIVAALPQVPLAVVDEYKTTEMARQDYFAANPPTGWHRLLPLTMQTPPVPVDDFVAVRLGRKFLGKL